MKTYLEERQRVGSEVAFNVKKYLRFECPHFCEGIHNEHVQLSSIPEEAHRYVVTPLEWFIDRYKITQDYHKRPPAGSITPRPHHSNRTDCLCQYRINQNY